MSRFYRRPEVESRTGLGKSEIYRREARGEFPKRLKLGARYTAWVAEEVDQWVHDQIRRVRGSAA
jgi:prophage regulatory protein